MPIPPLQEDGLLPPGLYMATIDEIEECFGKGTERRRELMARLRTFVDLAYHCGATRILVDGSFVTSKPEPGDVDVVIWVGNRFRELLRAGDAQALLLQQIFIRREPEEAFFVVDEVGWNDWFEFFSVFKQDPDRRKGLVEVQLP